MFKNVYQRAMSCKSLRKTTESMSRSKHWFSVVWGQRGAKQLIFLRLIKKKILTENV